MVTRVVPIFLPRIDSERSVSGVTSATSASPTVTSVKLASSRISSVLPTVTMTVAVRLVALIAT